MEGKFWKGFVVLKWYFPCSFYIMHSWWKKLEIHISFLPVKEGCCLLTGCSKYGITLLLDAWWEMRRFPNVTFYAITSNKTYQMNNKIMRYILEWVWISKFKVYTYCMIYFYMSVWKYIIIQTKDKK